MIYPEDVEIHDKFIQDHRVCQFPYAIDNKYKSIKKEILKMEPLPSIDYSYNMVMREETRSQVL